MRLLLGYLTSVRKLSTKTMNLLDEAKKIAAFAAVDDYVRNGNAIGVGSGSTVVHVIKRLAEKVNGGNFSVTCVPTSFQSRQLLIESNLIVSDLEQTPSLDVCIDGADEVDADMNLIKGGGGCLLQEKIVASCAKQLIIVADYTKDSTHLGDQYKNGIPLEVVPMAYKAIKGRVEARFGGILNLRMAVKKAGPVVTDNGNFILDWTDFDKCSNWEEVNRDIIQMPGVVETGLFIGMAKEAYFGLSDGSVKKRGHSKRECSKCSNKINK